GQSWNMYAYVRNNPLRFVDPGGRAFCSIDEGTANSKGGNESEEACATAGGTWVYQPSDFYSQFAGTPAPPPIKVPGAPNSDWKWSPDRFNPRGGTWRPTNYPTAPGSPGGTPNASWDPGGDGRP